jgi:hypothetical protein
MYNKHISQNKIDTYQAIKMIQIETLLSIYRALIRSTDTLLSL